MVRKAVEIADDRGLLDEFNRSPPSLSKGIPRQASLTESRVRRILELLDYYGLQEHKQKWLLLAIALAAEHPGFHPAARRQGRPRTIVDRAKLYDAVQAIDAVAARRRNAIENDEDLRRLVDLIGTDDEVRFRKRRKGMIFRRLSFASDSPWFGKGEAAIHHAYYTERTARQVKAARVQDIEGDATRPELTSSRKSSGE